KQKEGHTVCLYLHHFQAFEFVARLGFPTKIISNSAKTINGAAVILPKILRHPDVFRCFSDHLGL
uniref:Uncharacterized protein n=1 Tax=Amphimedon queenslandica TaxID=400682 RepID=A0A1X7U6J0_AMPQE